MAGTKLPWNKTHFQLILRKIFPRKLYEVDVELLHKRDTVPPNVFIINRLINKRRT